jgi:UDP-sugar pyrophosphorylase
MKSIGGEPVDDKGYSRYPGNINSLLFSLQQYSNILQESKGLIAEFINPKYADNTKTKFKSPTRLECMM